MSISKKLTIIAENEQKVYDAGKQEEYDRFWDSYQENGTRGSYSYAFYGPGWNDETFRPKYNIVASQSGNTFTSPFQGCRITDLVALLEQQGIIIDTSQYKGINSASWFPGAEKLTRVPYLDVSTSINGVGNMFAYDRKLHTVEGMKLSSTGTTFASTSFEFCESLANIRFEGGVIIGNFDIRYSPLTRASMENIVSVLSDTETGKTVYFKKTAKTAAFTDAEWSELIGTKPNWTFSLV